MTSRIIKVGLAAVVNGQLLVLRKRGGRTFILPGGKPEDDEDDRTTLLRELDEEIGCSATDLHFEGAFVDQAADMQDVEVEVRLYTGRLIGTPSVRSEIEEMAWIQLDADPQVPLASSIIRKILPHLHRRYQNLWTSFA
jgi:8-oxo-dGTP diphosphatase